jgi:hypothetical protein
VPIAVLALYGGLALLLEEGHQRMVLPLGRRGRARTSLEGDFGTQVHQAEQEPGSAASCDGRARAADDIDHPERTVWCLR